MKIFMIEWWCGNLGKYNQEYYLHLDAAAQRFKMIESDIEESEANLTTIFVDAESKLFGQ